MLNSSTGIFSFQFSSMDGLDAMLENGPSFIRNNPIILKMWNLDVDLLKEDVGNVPIWVKLHGVPVTAFSDDGLSVMATKLALIEVQADVELKDNIVVDMPKLVGGGDECPKNIDSDVVKNMKKPSQTPREKDVEPTIEVSNSNPFDVLNSVENDVDLGTIGGTSIMASKKANSSGSSFWNVESSSTSTTPIVEKIDKIERLIIKGRLPLWMLRESYVNGDYDFNPYEDDMYEGQDIPDKIQDICDNFDITVRGRKKK
ncbi:ATPase, F1/V1/A1 complex, alpha/beta subunit [Tanacetum coccineum]